MTEQEREEKLKAMLETGEGLEEGRALYGFIAGGIGCFITRVPVCAGIVCEVREWEGIHLLVGPTEGSAILMHDDKVRRVWAKVVEKWGEEAGKLVDEVVA